MQKRRPLAFYALFFALAASLLGGLGACQAEAQLGPEAGVAGSRKFGFGNSGLARAVQGQVWYPAAAGSKERTMYYSSMVWGRAAADAAPLAVQAPRPLVVLAHGWRGTRFDLSWLGEALARQGYVVAAVNMPGSDATSFDDAQAPKSWFRANLLSKSIDALAVDPFLGPLTDTQRVAVIGHSAGGSTAWVLGGAQLDPNLFAQLFPASAPVVAGTWSDTRIKALVGLNPGSGPAFAAQGLQQLHLPVLIVSGTGDHVAPESQNAGFFAAHIDHALWLRFQGVDHYSFMPVCSPWGRLRRFGACIESHPEVDRAYVHQQTWVQLEAFLRQALPLDPGTQGQRPWPRLDISPEPVAASTAAAPSGR